MADTRDRAPDLGVYAAQDPNARPVTEIVAGLFAGVWVVVSGAFLWRTFAAGADSPTLAMTALAVVLPLALLWLAVSSMRSIRALREEAARLQVTVDAMRHAYVLAQQTAGAAKPAVEKRIEELAAAQRETQAQLATFTSRRDPAGTAAPSRIAPAYAPAPGAAAQAEAEQPALALNTPPEPLRDPLSVADFVRALNFPDSAEDRDGFRALRLALEDRRASRLIRAAQDVLTLLAQEGIYMDDLRPDRARIDLWRRFAAGERGRAISGLGGIRDRSSLALTTARMREDPVFRDAAHHFLRAFDHTLQDFEKQASDAELADLAETRTARAFMLFGRVTGIFD